MDSEAIVKAALNGRASKYPLSAQTVPMEVAIRSKSDPAALWPGAPPNFGQPDMPHIFSFVGRYGMVANAYMHADEALMHSAQNAEIMRNEPMIMECIEARMRCVALLNWHIQPVDNDVLRDALEKTDSQETAMSIRRALKKPKSDAEMMADKLTSILKHTPHFMKMRYSLMDAIWYGKYATVQTMGVRNIGGQRRIFVRKWEPRHGDKLIFRYADESYEYDPDQVGIRIGPTFHGHDDSWTDYAGFERKRIDPTQHGLVYWFDGQQRRRIALHKHIIEDADFMRPEKAGSINGVGIRSRIYWTWWAYQECLKLLLEYVERSALGIEIWKYPAHDPKAKERTEQAAQERGAPGRSVVLVPIPTGEYGDMYGVQIVEPGLGGINELQSVLQQFFGHKIKRYILGQTLTSEAEATGMGSGVADAHLATFHDIVRFDGLNLEETLTSDLLRPLQQWNFPGTDDIFLRFVIDTESPDAQERIASYQAAWSMGLKIRTEDMYDALGAAPPQDGEDFLGNPGLEGAVLANEAQKLQMAQMQAQMQAQPAMFGPFPEMGGVPGDGDGDGMANDEQAQQFQARAKVDRYALKKNGEGVERYSQEPIVQNLKDEHHGDLGNALKEAEKKQGIPFHSPNFYAKRGLDPNQELTHDDQHLILLHAGYLDHPEVSKKLFGDSYNSTSGSQVPSQPLGKFMVSAGRALREHGTEAKRANALNRIGGAKVVSFKNQSGGRLVLHPAVRKDATSGWQLTSMSGHDGKPNGHYNPKSFDHGWQNALGIGEDGYWNEHGYEVEWTDKDGTKAPFSASGDYWLEVERFGRYKPMKGQGSFNWDEEQHPRETEEHDGKRPGEFAPKEQEHEAAGNRQQPSEASQVPPVEAEPAAVEFDLEPHEKAALKVTKLRGVEQRADHIWFVPQSVMTPERRKSLMSESEKQRFSGRMGGKLIEVKDWADVSGNQQERGYAIIDRRPAMQERQKAFEDAANLRKWTNNGDGTYTAPNGTIWRKAKAGGEESPVNGKWFAGGALMPIHGLASGQPKPPPKPKGSGSNSVSPDEEKGKEWRAPKVRQLSEREREEREEQRRWDALRSTAVGQVYELKDKPGVAWKDLKKLAVPYLSKLSQEQLQSLGQQLRAKLIEREVNKYFKPGEDERLLRGDKVTRGELAKIVAEEFDYQVNHPQNPISAKVRKQFPGIDVAAEGLRQWHDEKYLSIDRAEELAAILPKPGTVDRLSAEDWAEIERYARLKPMAGQSSFDWDESEHPRETEAHDGKKPGEFAPKRYQEWDSQRHPKNNDKPTSFLTGHSSLPVREAAKKNAGLGLLITPLTQQYIEHAGDYSHIALDNGVYSEFTGSQPFSAEKFRAMIKKVAGNPELAAKTQFVVAPDVVGDWEKTLERSKPWLPEIRKSGLPVAFAAQDGIEKHLDKIPWDDFDVLFIGGSTAWKLGFNPIEGAFRPTDEQLRQSGFNHDFSKMLKEAKARGKRIHMGRVNSWKRAEMANYGMQVDTMDGNFIGVAPDQNLPKVLGWLNAITNGMQKPEDSATDAKGDGKKKAQAILASKGGDKYANRVQASLLHTGTTEADWQAVPVIGMNQVDNGRGGQASLPVFDMPKGFKQAKTPFSDDEQCCHLCGKGIKNVWHIMAPKHKLTMQVGSECVGHFGEGISGERQAKRDIHAQRRDFVGQLENLKQELKDAGMKEYEQREYGYDKGKPISWTRKVKRWAKETPEGRRALELHDKLNDALSYQRGRISAGKDQFGEWHESDRVLANWEKLKGEQAKGLHAEISAFLAESKPKQAEARSVPVHPDILDEWRSSERWAYDNADEWAHVNDSDPADFDKWVKLRDKVQSASETVSPDLQFHLWDWLNEQADGDIPTGWKQAEKQLGVQLGIYRPWSDDDSKAVEFTSRGQRAAKPLFKLGGKSFALDDNRLQELQKDRYGQMFFDFDKPKQAEQTVEKQPEPSKPAEPEHPIVTKLRRYLDLKEQAAKRGLREPRTNLLK